MTHPLPDPFRAIAGQPFPVYPCETGAWSIKPTTGPAPVRVMICAIPKAGTHLYDRLLSLLGLVPANLSFNADYLNDFRFLDPRNARFHNLETRLWIPIEVSSTLIQPGQFGVGHLPATQRVWDLLSGFKIIFVTREMRAATVSQMRYVCDSDWLPPGRDTDVDWRDAPHGPAKLLRYFDDIAPFYFNDRCHPMVGWSEVANVLKLTYEQIIGDAGLAAQVETVRSVAAFCELNQPSDPGEVLRQLLGKPTITYSGKRTRWEECWNGEVERRFGDFGGPELNRRFGFPA